MKKYISILLVIVMIMAFNIPSASFALAGFTDESGFTTDGSGTIIGYNGTMPPSGYAYATLQIPDEINGVTITSIGNNFLKDNEYISHVIIPASVTSIGDNAFYGCSNLTGVFFLSKQGDSLIIGTNAFKIGDEGSEYFSESLEMRGYTNSPAGTFATENSITYSSFEDDFTINPSTHTITGYVGPDYPIVTVIPNEVSGTAITTIGDEAFKQSNKMGWHVVISEGMTTIETDAFNQCSSIRTVDFPDSLTSIGACAFQYSYLREVEIPSTVTFMGIHAFGSCGYLTDITLKDGLNTLGGASTFYGCVNLTSVSIPDSITAIPGEAFRYCIKLNSVAFPDSLTSIGADSFSNCEDLTALNLPESLTAIGSSAFAGCNALSGTTVVIPQNVTSIGSHAFHTGSDDNSLIHPESDLSISNLTLKILNGYQSGDTGALTFDCNIMTTYGSHDNGIQAYPMSAAFHVAKQISTWRYTPVYTAESDFTFSGGSITGYTGNDRFVNLPRQINAQPVTSIAANAFSNNTTIAAVMLPETVTAIGNNAFSGCTSLIRATIYGNTTAFGTTPFSGVNGAFEINAFSNSDAYFYALNQSLDYEELSEFIVCGDDSNEVNLFGTGFEPPNGIFTIPSTIGGISILRVISCETNNTSITGLVVPEGIITLGTQTYPLPKYMTQITLPTTLTEIYSGAFNNCLDLSSINLTEPNINYTVDSNILFNNDETTLIKYPADKSGTAYEVSDAVTAISYCAFLSSQNLNSVTIKNPACTIGDYAFFDMPSGFTLYGYNGSTAQTYADANGITFSPLSVSATGISVKTPPTKTVYTSGESLDLSGMVVTLTQEATPASINVDSADFGSFGITTNPVNGAVLTASDTTVTVTCNSHSDTQAITVNTDTTAPTLSGTSASGITATGATLNFTSDEAGTYYYLVYAAADSSPSAVTIKAQGAAVVKGTGAAVTAANTASVTGLSASTAYKAYVIVEDAAGNPSAVATIDITTNAIPDTTAPTLSGTSASGITATGATLNFTSDEAGTYYYLVYAAADSSPSAVTIKAQGAAVVKGTGAAVTAANTASITGLSASTAYKAYVIVEDAAGNPSAVATTDIATTAVPNPTTPTSVSSGGGGGTTSSTTEPVETNTAEKDKIASITVVSTTQTADGVAVGAVSSEIAKILVEKAKTTEKEGNAAIVKFAVKTNVNTKAANISIPRDAIDQLAGDTDSDMKIESNIGWMTFDSTATEAISGADNSEDVKFGIGKVEKDSLDQAVQQKIGDRPVYDFSVTAGDSPVSDFNGGSVNIAIPYTLQDNEKPEAVVVYYINDSGELIPVEGKYNSETSLVEFTVNHFSKYLISYHEVNFTDVGENAWYHDAVTFAAARGITAGIGNDMFGPNQVLTRAQLLVMVMRAYGIDPEENSDENFVDAGDAYYTGYLAAAKKLGISEGIGNNRFNPQGVITRQDMLTMLYRALDTLDKIPDVEDQNDLQAFSDADSISDYAKTAINHLVSSGIISGSNGKLEPLSGSTRAQMAQVLYNLLSN